MSELLRKDLTFQIKAVDGDDSPHGSFDVYAAVFGNVDRGGDVIEPGAFLNLDEFVADGVVLYCHKMDEPPIAMVDAAFQDARGLRVKGRFHSDPFSQRIRTICRERMTAGKSVKCSIGYRIVDASQEKRGGRTVQHLNKLLVFEFSFVNLPMNPLAGAVAAKGLIAGGEGPDVATKLGLLDTVKTMLGLRIEPAPDVSTKKGRRMAKGTLGELRKFSGAARVLGDAGSEHDKALRTLGKSMKDHAAGLLAFADALDSHLSQFDDPEDEGDDQADDDRGDKADGDVEAKAEADRLRLKLRARDDSIDLDD